MDLDPTVRFSARVDDYIRYRPSYPADLVTLLKRECGLTPHSRIADIGSGTGLLSELFLRYGCEIFGVEPNPDMRKAGERLLAAWPRFHSVEGRAEATTLADGSVDLVTAAQSFHWFDPDRARREFRRILKPAGWVALVWNERLPASGFMAGYEDLVTRYGPERPRVDEERLHRFFGHGNWTLTLLSNQQQFDLDGLRGRFLSSSYAPMRGTPASAALIEEIDRLFTQYESLGLVTLLYETRVYVGCLG